MYIVRIHASVAVYIEAFALLVCYAALVGGWIPTFQDSLSVSVQVECWEQVGAL